MKQKHGMQLHTNARQHHSGKQQHPQQQEQPLIHPHPSPLPFEQFDQETHRPPVESGNPPTMDQVHGDRGRHCRKTKGQSAEENHERVPPLPAPARRISARTSINAKSSSLRQARNCA